MFNDLPGALTHFNGLEEILRRRGGLGVLQNETMRTMLFWYLVIVICYSIFFVSKLINLLGLMSILLFCEIALLAFHGLKIFCLRFTFLRPHWHLQSDH